MGVAMTYSTPGADDERISEEDMGQDSTLTTDRPATHDTLVM
jgi:hypothetical protein